MMDKAHIVIKPAVNREGEDHLVSQCGTIDGAVRLQLSIPLSRIPGRFLKGSASGYLVVDCSINGLYFSDVPLKTGSDDHADFDKRMKQRGNLLNDTVDFELRSNVVEEHDR